MADIAVRDTSVGFAPWITMADHIRDAVAFDRRSIQNYVEESSLGRRVRFFVFTFETIFDLARLNTPPTLHA
jgi:hypothetical protein